MRKTATSILAGLVFTAFASAAMAGSLLTETFTYPDGDLITNAGWSSYSGAGAGDIAVSSGQAIGKTVQFPDDHRALTSARLASDKTYFCFNVSIADPGGAPKLVYFAELKDAGSSLIVGRTYVVPLSIGGFTFGVSTTSTNTTTQSVTPWSLVSLNYGQTYKVVVAYDGTAKNATLWVDPVNDASPNVVDSNAGAASVAVTHFGLRQSNSASAFVPNPNFNGGGVDWVYTVDNVGVGVSMADACDAIVPAGKTTWGKIKSIYR